VNGEYQSLHLKEDGTHNMYHNSIKILDPKLINPQGNKIPLRIPFRSRFSNYVWAKVSA
jgi:hypothetical protein